MSVPTVELIDAPAPRRFLQTPPGRALRALASLKLTVTLFALSLVLVFVGTLAQMDNGLQTVLKNYFRSWVVMVPLQLFVRLGQVFFNVPTTVSAPEWAAIPFPGGWTIGGLLLLNLFAAYLTRFKFSWKRSGILFLHAGVILLLLGELVTGVFGVESRMSIGEGESADYAFRIHESELVLVGRSDPSIDDVIAIPVGRMTPGTTVRDPQVPADVEVLSYMKNSSLVKRTAEDKDNPATAGVGLKAAALPQRENPGTSSAVDIPSAYVTLKDKAGKAVGTYLVSAALDPQPVEIDGKPYELALRFRRDYKPYTVHLLEFRFDRYQGTEIAKNYSSRVRLTDPSRGVDREVLIRMNEPLRYEGETFYQSGFDETTERGTVLQVVRNPAWTWPYIACLLVTLGMTVHFGLQLNRFLGRRVAA